MNINNNNISTFTNDILQSYKVDKKVESSFNNINHNTSAYALDISLRGLNILKTSDEKEIAIYNTDAWAYTKDLRIINKMI